MGLMAKMCESPGKCHSECLLIINDEDSHGSLFRTRLAWWEGDAPGWPILAGMSSHCRVMLQENLRSTSSSGQS